MYIKKIYTNIQQRGRKDFFPSVMDEVEAKSWLP